MNQHPRSNLATNAPRFEARLHRSVALLTLVAVLPASHVGAQPARGAATAGDATPRAPAAADASSASGGIAVAVAPDSPQASVTRFLTLARAGRFEQAASFLDVPRRSQGPAAAEKLVLVLDHELWIDVDRLSPDSGGDLEDGLPRGVDVVGSIATDDTPTGEPVRIARVVTDSGVRWRFTRATCARIDGWYNAVEGQQIRRYVPRRLLGDGPFHIAPWQWMALAIAALGALLIGVLLGRITRFLLARLAARTKPVWDDELVEALRGPIRLGWALIAFQLALPWLGLVLPAETAIARGEKLAAALIFLVAAIRSVRVLSEHLARSEWGRSNPSSRSLLALSGRAAQLAAALMAFLITLSALGYDVTGVLAGVGIGGIALAFAAQKTLENLLGAFAIGIDQPLREGDIVNIDGVIGTVEGVGLRSTRVRTLDRHVVSFPNGKLADTAINSMSARDRMRIAGLLSIQYGTGSAQLRALRDALEASARAHDFVLTEELIIRFAGFGASSLDFELVIWLDVRDYNSFVEKREIVMFSLMETVESMGLSIASPMRTLAWAPGDSIPRS